MYNLINNSGMVITIPDWQKIYYKDLTLIGKKTMDWNEPLVQNFIILLDRIERLENKLKVPDIETSETIGLFDFSAKKIDYLYGTETSETIGLFDYN